MTSARMVAFLLFVCKILMFSVNIVPHHSSEFLAIWLRGLLLVEVFAQALDIFRH